MFSMLHIALHRLVCKSQFLQEVTSAQITKCATLLCNSMLKVVQLHKFKIHRENLTTVLKSAPQNYPKNALKPQSHKRSQWGAKGAIPPKFLENIVMFCFERRFFKQNNVIRLKSNIFPPHIFGLAMPLPNPHEIHLKL